MKNPLRLAVFLALAPDETGGGAPATPAPEGHEPVDFEALADAAYDAVDHEDGEPHEVRAPSEEDVVADGAESHDGVRPDEGLAELPAEVAEKYPMVGHLRILDDALTDPTTAIATLRSFAQGVADHHGVDLASALGFGPPSGAHVAPGSREGAEPLTPGEKRLTQRLDALQSQIAPALQAQQAAARTAQYEDLVRRATPTAIDVVRSETGWTPSAEQVMRAAQAYPQLAAQSLSHAVQAACVKEIVSAARGNAKAERPRLDDMPLGGPRSGTRPYRPPEDGSVDWNKLAEAAYEAVVAS